MKRLLLLLLLVPLAQGITVTDSTATMTHLVDLSQLEPRQVPDAAPRCDDPRTEPAPGGQGPNAHVTTTTTNPPAMLFQEGNTERICAEVPFNVTIPEGADEAIIEFVTEREVETSLNLQARFEQSLLFHYEGQRIDCLASLDYVARHLPSQNMTPVKIHVPLGPEGCHGGRLHSQLELVFLFADRLEDPTTPSVTDHAFPGQAARAKVAGLRVTFTGIDMEARGIDEAGLHSNGNLLGYSRVRVDIPEPPAGYDVQGAFTVSNRYGTHSFYKVTPGGLQELESRFIKLEEEGGALQFIITPAAVAAAGAGTYEVHFESGATTIVSPAGLPVAGLALLAPIIFGVLAQRNLNHLQRTARGRLTTVRWALQASLVVAWLVYLAVVFALLISPIGPGMAARPVPPANIVAYTALGTASFMMIAVSIAGRRREMRIVVDDLTELERIQQELKRSNAELEQFAYVASHDLKEPLRMVAGFTQLLEKHLDDRLDDDGRKYLGFASEGSRRLQRMVDDLLLYSRVRHDQAALTDVNLADVMVIVRGHLAQLIQDRRVDLRVGELPTITADQGQMVQMLLNLVQNAIKFSPQDRPVVEVTAKRKGGNVHIAVRDEGVGIDPGQQERIFQIFQRLHLREEYDGNGIGLAMVKKIAEQAGGHIIVDSAKGKGSTFTVVLPDHPPRPPAPRGAAARAARRAEGAA